MMLRTKFTRTCYKAFLGVAILSLFLPMAACHFPRTIVPTKAAPIPHIKKLVVIGFQPVLSPGEESKVVRNPLSGAVFIAEPVTPDKAEKLTEKLFSSLLKDKGLDLVPPGMAMGVLSSLTDSNLLLEDRMAIQKIGHAFSADAILIGYVYRWRERQGTDYAVNRPASVAFDLYLVSADQGSILWKGKFDKTQKSLSENLFDMEFFIKGGGKWLTAEALAELGLSALYEEMPKSGKGRKSE